jgi:hypothetical protein
MEKEAAEGLSKFAGVQFNFAAIDAYNLPDNRQLAILAICNVA